VGYPLFVPRQLAAPAGLSRYLEAWARTPLRSWPGTKVNTGAPLSTLTRSGPRSSDKDDPEVRGVTEARGILPWILLPEGLRNVTLTVLAVALLRHA
jgi:hypothetical protein